MYSTYLSLKLLPCKSQIENMIYHAALQYSAYMSQGKSDTQMKWRKINIVHS